jgi:hypothetical protein
LGDKDPAQDQYLLLKLNPAKLLTLSVVLSETTTKVVNISQTLPIIRKMIETARTKPLLRLLLLVQNERNRL